MKSTITLLTLIFIFSATFLILPSFLDSSNSTVTKPYIITTLPVIADIVNNVAGERARVESLVKPGVTVVTYELVPTDAEKIAESDLFLYVGYGSEDVLGVYASNIKDGKGVVRLIDRVLGFTVKNPLDIPNPYFWLDPANVKKLVYEVTKLLSEIDPEGSYEYAINAEKYLAEIKDLDGWISSQIDRIPKERRKLVTIRDTMSYFANRYGLEILGYITGFAGMYEPQTRSVVELFERIAYEGVPVVFVEYEEASTTLREVIETMAEEAGIEVIEFIYVESLAPDHGVKTYTDMMRKNTEIIVASLSKPLKEDGAGLFKQNLLENPLFRVFKYEFMRRGALSLMFAMVATSLVGAFAVLRGWAIFGDALAHGAIVGLVAAYLFSFDFFLGALAAGLFVALAVSSIERRTRLRADVIIAVTFTSMIALAIAIISYIGGTTLSIEDILFADVTAVSQDMMVRTVLLSSAIIIFVLLLGKVLLLYTVDPLGATALGIRTGMVHYALLLLLAVTIVSAFMTVGAIPAIASLIIPPAAAFLISSRPVDFIAKSVAIAASSSIAGIYISYYLATNAGAAAILVAALIFSLCVVYRSLTKPSSVR